MYTERLSPVTAFISALLRSDTFLTLPGEQWKNWDAIVGQVLLTGPLCLSTLQQPDAATVNVCL